MLIEYFLMFDEKASRTVVPALCNSDIVQTIDTVRVRSK